MAKVLYNVHWRDGEPSIPALCEKFGFRPEDLDQEFGVVEVDPQNQVFCILLDDKVAARLSPEWGKGDEEGPRLEGPFSNPKIEPFGPPES